MADGELTGGNFRIAVLDRDGTFLRQWRFTARRARRLRRCRTACGCRMTVSYTSATGRRTASRSSIAGRVFQRNIDLPFTPVTPRTADRSGTRGTAVVLDFSPDPEQRWIFVLNQNRVRVDVVDRQRGEVVTSFGGGPGRYPGQFTLPHGIGVDSNGNVYVAEQEGRRIQRFTR